LPHGGKLHESLCPLQKYKEANETVHWLKRLYRPGYLSETDYQALDSSCTRIRVMLIFSIQTANETLSLHFNPPTIPPYLQFLQISVESA